VSLKKDRTGDATGYRQMTTVLSNPKMRANMLQDALDELEYFKSKYSELKELSDVFASIETTKKKIAKSLAKNKAKKAA
jgi:hypothetical protein